MSLAHGVSDSVCLGWGLRNCISSKFPVILMLLIWQPHLQNFWAGAFLKGSGLRTVWIQIMLSQYSLSGIPCRFSSKQRLMGPSCTQDPCPLVKTAWMPSLQFPTHSLGLAMAKRTECQRMFERRRLDASWELPRAAVSLQFLTLIY